MRRSCRVGLLCVVLMVLANCPAYADGGSSIASAPAVPAGAQQFGSLGPSSYTYEHRDLNECYAAFRSWWALSIVAGDSVQIDWEAQNGAVGLNIWAPGTTDFNFPQTNPITHEGLSTATNKAELTYGFDASGIYPLEFFDVFQIGCGGKPAPVGPYSFTVLVTHALSLALPFVHTLLPKGKLVVGVHDPAGGPIDNPGVIVELQIKGRGRWITIGKAPVSSSAAAIAYTVPRSLRHNRHVTLRALAAGPGYRAAGSAHIKVRTR